MKQKASYLSAFLNIGKWAAMSNLIFFPFFVAPFLVQGQYLLKKEKEFHIDSLYPVELVDYHPGQGLYLGYVEMRSKGVEVVLVNEEGEIVVQKK
ncbi:MAG TPA: hypothetical protein VK014_08530 [Cyclobacteriaceae bacterium]|nr:hypothetical protein [Cyclobacteriaceae bacterium]